MKTVIKVILVQLLIAGILAVIATTVKNIRNRNYEMKKRYAVKYSKKYIEDFEERAKERQKKYRRDESKYFKSKSQSPGTGTLIRSSKPRYSENKKKSFK